MELIDLYQKVLNAKYTQLEEQSASYAVEREGDTLRLLFEKSNGRIDWRNNFKFLAIPKKPYKDMDDTWFTHRGFFGVWEAIEPRLADAIADPSVKHFDIAGYSHGGALALLCFEYCKYHRPDAEVTGVGFGAPRVVWGPVPKSLKERLADFRVIRNGDDLITHLPPRLFGYRQLGKLEKVGKKDGPIEDHRAQAYTSAMMQ